MEPSFHHFRNLNPPSQFKQNVLARVAKRSSILFPKMVLVVGACMIMVMGFWVSPRPVEASTDLAVAELSTHYIEPDAVADWMLTH